MTLDLPKTTDDILTRDVHLVQSWQGILSGILDSSFLTHVYRKHQV